MAKKYFSVFSAVVCMLLTMLCGCMSVDCVMTETFPPVDEVRKYDKAVEIPYEYSVIGVCQTEGNYTEFSYDDMMKRIVERAGENGAEEQGDRPALPPEARRLHCRSYFHSQEAELRSA